MSLNGVMALVLRYLTEFGSWGALRKSSRPLSHLLMSSYYWLVGWFRP